MKKNNKRGFAILAVLLTILLVFAGCGTGVSSGDPASGNNTSGDSVQEQQDQNAEGSTETPTVTITIPGVDADNFPRIDGSTAVMPLLAGLYSRALGISVEDSEAMVTVSGGTGAVWRNLIWDGADLLIVYEAPENIKEELESEGLELEIDPIGRDGLVFLVNKSNPVEDLSVLQLQDIYTDKIIDWKDVGGTPGPISAFQRNAESGSQTLFLKLLMDGIEPADPPIELVMSSMSGLIEEVAAFDGSGGAIGYSVFYYADLMFANPDLKLLAVDGVQPSNDSIQNGDYPLVNDFYIVIRADEPEDSPARLLRDWFLTDEGTALLVAENYVSVR